MGFWMNGEWYDEFETEDDYWRWEYLMSKDDFVKPSKPSGVGWAIEYFKNLFKSDDKPKINNEAQVKLNDIPVPNIIPQSPESYNKKLTIGELES